MALALVHDVCLSVLGSGPRSLCSFRVPIVTAVGSLKHVAD
jgi:hypothetical protein